jgi:hypothetical protein
MQGHLPCSKLFRQAIEAVKNNALHQPNTARENLTYLFGFLQSAW